MSLLDEVVLKELVNTISNRYFNKPFVDDVSFNHRLRTTGGRYIPSKRLIELNPKYYLEACESEFIGIIKHELCHYHLHIEGKGYNHGDHAFKALLKKTNSPRFCKPLPSNQVYKYIYKCIKCKQIYKRKKLVNLKRYACGKCLGKLEKVE